MAKTAQEFLSQLDSSGLVPPEVLESLRRQVAKAAKPVSAGTLARVLVDHGHLTEAQGERLAEAPLPASRKSSSASGVLGLEPIGNSPTPSTTKPVTKAPTKGPPKTPAEIDASAAALGLAPIYEESKTTPKPAAAVKVAPTKTAPPSKPAGGVSPSTISKAKPLPALAPLDGLQPLAPLPGDDLFGAAPLADPFAAPDPFAAAAPTQKVASAATLPSDPLSAAAAAVPLAVPQAAAKPTGPRRPRSKALPVIAAVVVILLIGGGIGGYALTRSNGNHEFNLAEQDYQAKQYDAAAGKFSAFLEDFPANSQAGTARVHRAMAKILAASPSKDNHSAMLAAAKASLPSVGGEPGLTQLHAELAPLLIDLATSLAQQAGQEKSAAESATRLSEAKDALALTNDARFVPSTLRQWQRLAETEESLALIERELGRGKALEEALGQIKKNAESGKLAAALAERQKLLAVYPELAKDVALRDLGTQIAKSAAASVKTSAEAAKGDSAEAKSPVLASVSFSSGKESPAAETPERTFFTLAAGFVWALDGGSGKLLWSRPAGRTSGRAISPISPDAGSNVVFADLFHNEVVCVNPRSGALRWRHSFQEPLVGEPLIMDGQIIVATTNGKIVALDAQSGNGKVAAQLPQSVRVSPASRSGQILVVAESSFLYILSPDLKCAAAVYVGHEPGSIETPPVILAKHAVVAENRLQKSLLRVVALDEKGLAAGPSQQVEVVGQVTTPPVQLGERLLVLTDQQTVAFDYQPSNDEPLKQLGETKTTTAQPLIRHGAVCADKLWVADDGLHRFDFLPAGGTVKEAWVGFAGETLESPPEGIADLVYCLRRGPGNHGYIATALKGSSGETLWETQLAQPVESLAITADKQSAVVVCAPGREAKIDLAGMKGPNAAAMGPTIFPIKSTFPWGGGAISIHDSVHLLDSKVETDLADPFQMSVRPGVPRGKPSAAAAGSGGESLVVSDGGTLLYHLRLEKEPRPHLVQIAKASLNSPVNAPVAVLGDSVFVVNKDGTLVVLKLPDLKPIQSIKLNCQVVPFGPQRVGQSILIATDRQELVRLDGSGKMLWKIPLTDGSLAGPPQEVGKDLVLPIRGGILVRIAASSGKEIARGNTGQPLAGPTALVDGGLLVSTAAGGILKVATPEKK